MGNITRGSIQSLFLKPHFLGPFNKVSSVSIFSFISALATGVVLNDSPKCLLLKHASVHRYTLSLDEHAQLRKTPHLYCWFWTNNQYSKFRGFLHDIAACFPLTLVHVSKFQQSFGNSRAKFRPLSMQPIQTLAFPPCIIAPVALCLPHYTRNRCFWKLVA